MATGRQSHGDERRDDSDRLSGARIDLRPVAPQDATALFAHINDRDTVRMLARVPWPVTPADVAVFVNGAARRRLRGAAFEYVLVPREATPGPIGIVGFEFDGAGGVGHVGYWLGRAYQGRGLMTEALRLAIPHVFRTFAIDRMDSGAFFDNAASLRVQHKLGFEIVGEHEIYCRARGHGIRHIDTRLTRTRALEAAA